MIETQTLGPLLRSYRHRVRSGEAEREEVSATVTRRSGFQNEATAGSGHNLLVDEPETFGGGGEAPDPAELLLAAIGASLSVTITAHAALEDLPLSGVVIVLDAWMDALSFFEPGGASQAGFRELTIKVRVATSLDEARARTLLETSLAASPVLRSLTVKPIVHFEIGSLL